MTAGMVVTALTGSSHEPPMMVAGPLVAASAPAAPTSSATGADQRATRGSRGTERAPLQTDTSAGVRSRVLLTQRDAIADEQATLEGKRAEAKRRLAADKKAERKAAEKKRQAAAERKAAEQTVEKKAADKAEREEAEADGSAAAEQESYDADTTSPKTIARQMMESRYGWGSKQFGCYNNIIMRESAWKVDADNPTSSAYGIPQALPGRKMASAGSDWRTNPATQIEWGLGYVKSRYGTPCSAWSFKRSHGWY